MQQPFGAMRHTPPERNPKTSQRRGYPIAQALRPCSRRVLPLHPRPRRQRFIKVHRAQRHRLPLQPHLRPRVPPIQPDRRLHRRLHLRLIQPRERRQRREGHARLVLEFPPLDRFGQGPAREDALPAVPEILLQIERFAGELAVVVLERDVPGSGGGAELGVLLGGDALELLGLLLAQDIDARGVEAVHAAADVVLLLELLEVLLGDFAARHAVRAAVAVGVHVAEPGLARSALGLEGAREVQLGGEVAVLEVGEDFDVAVL